MSIFGVDANKTNQNLYNQQVTTQTGNAFGAQTGKDSIGAAAQGNITGGINVNTGKQGTTNVTFQSSDAAAIAAVENIAHHSNDLALGALQYNQDLSTLSVSLANQNANMALETLQTLNTEHQVAGAGGTAADVAGVATAAAGYDDGSNTKLYMAIGVAVIVAAIVYIKVR